jgi:hypothetical protein
MTKRFILNKRRKAVNNRNRKRRLPINGKAQGFHTVNLLSKIVPDRTQVKLDVSSFVTFQFLSASFYATYKGNDLVNPGNGTWVNQPAGFIDWMNFYQYFRVIGSRIQLQMVNDGDNARNRGVWIAVYPTRVSDASTLSGGYINGKAQPYAVGKFLGAPTGFDVVTINNAMSTSKFWGYSAYNDVDFMGVVDTAPVNQWYWAIAITGLSDGGTEFAILTGTVTISYICQFIERKPITMTFPG